MVNAITVNKRLAIPIRIQHTKRMPRAAIDRDIDRKPPKRDSATSFGIPISISDTLAAMRPGESFVVDLSKHRGHALVSGSRRGFRMSSEKENGRYRVWRIA